MAAECWPWTSSRKRPVSSTAWYAPGGGRNIRASGTTSARQRTPWASLRAKIAQDKPDIVELYGQGDILANIHLGEIIDCIHAHGLPVRLITNCYLLGIDGHMEVASKCEEVVGAFGIIDEKGFRKYHRPLPELGFTAEKQTESIVRFSQQYQGKFKLRVFSARGSTTPMNRLNSSGP